MSPFNLNLNAIHIQLGYGVTDNRGDDANEMGDNLDSIDLGTGFDIESMSCGSSHICAVSTDRDLKCWGRNSYGQVLH